MDPFRAALRYRSPGVGVVVLHRGPAHLETPRRPPGQSDQRLQNSHTTARKSQTTDPKTVTPQRSENSQTTAQNSQTTAQNSRSRAQNSHTTEPRTSHHRAQNSHTTAPKTTRSPKGRVASLVCSAHLEEADPVLGAPAVLGGDAVVAVHPGLREVRLAHVTEHHAGRFPHSAVWRENSDTL